MNGLDDKIWQEFYCRKSGGGCGGYILVRLNPKINGVVEVVCPKCKHKHQRKIVNGEIKEDGRFSSSPKQEIVPTMDAWNEKSQMGFSGEDGNSCIGRNFLRESWADRFGVCGR